MSPTPRDRELDTVLGAYALDAVDGPERTAVAAYVERTPEARDELDALREVAAALAVLASEEVDPPVGSWTRLAARLGDAAVESPSRLDGRDRAAVLAKPTPIAARRDRRTVPTRLAAVVTAAAVLVAALLGVRVLDQARRLDDLRAANGALAAAADAAFSDPAARTAALRDAPAGAALRVAYLPDGTGFLVSEGLAVLPATRTYQLWALVGDAEAPTAISAGVLGRDPTVTGFRVSGPVVGFAVTVEVRGGVVASEQPALAIGRLAA